MVLMMMVAAKDDGNDVIIVARCYSAHNVHDILIFRYTTAIFNMINKLLNWRVYFLYQLFLLLLLLLLLFKNLPSHIHIHMLQPVVYRYRYFNFHFIINYVPQFFFFYFVSSFLHFYRNEREFFLSLSVPLNLGLCFKHFSF